MRPIVQILIFFFLCAIFCVNIGGCLKDTSLPEGFAAIIMVFGAAFLAGFIVIKGEELIRGTVNKVDNYIEEEKEKKEIKSIVNAEINEYKKAKNSFQFFSDEKLMELYEKNIKEKNEDSEMLALEEELIKRGKIDHSTMHEKIYNLRKKIE